jgi:hypothetical protein
MMGKNNTTTTKLARKKIKIPEAFFATGIVIMYDVNSLLGC